MGLGRKGRLPVFSSGFRFRYVLNRKLDAQDVSLVAKSDGASQLGELRELLAGGFSLEREQFDDLAKRSRVLRCVT